jgi:hypothetical protein
MQFVSEDKKTITLPVPLGTVLYRFHTKCNDACLFQKDNFDAVFPPTETGRCSREMPCHVKCTGARGIVVELSNVAMLEREWNKFVFETEIEAIIAGMEFVGLHQNQMLAVGLEI